MDQEHELRIALDSLLQQWEKNQKTHILDGAEDAATLLEHRFYSFIEVFRKWFISMNNKPNSLEEALKQRVILEIVDLLPSPLYIPFENEVDLLVDGVEQENDEKYD